MNELREEQLKNQIKTAFVKQDVNLEQPNCMGALITAASKMANVSNIIDEISTVDELVDLFKASEEAKGLIGMPPQFVNSNIGYSVDFQDFSAAMNEYTVNKNNYDEIYNGILNRSQERNNGREM